MTKEKKPPVTEQQSKGEIVLFQASDGHAKIQVRVENKTVWLSQKNLADLYQVSVPSINEYLRKISG